MLACDYRVTICGNGITKQQPSLRIVYKLDRATRRRPRPDRLQGAKVSRLPRSRGLPGGYRSLKRRLLWASITLRKDLNTNNGDDRASALGASDPDHRNRRWQ